MKKVLIIFAVITASAFAADLYCCWNPNSESDLAGYLLYLRADTTDVWLPPTDLPANSVRYDFIWPAKIGVCAMIKAYDQAGNVSEPSDVACLVVSPTPLVGDLTEDGRLSAADVIEWRRLFRADPSDPKLDINGNGMNTAADLVLLRQIVKDASFN